MLPTRLFAAAVALLATSLFAPAQAQNWPTRTVKLIVPFGPGAGADIGGRLFAEKLTQKWGHPVVIENRPGGDSIVAIQAFLSRPPTTTTSCCSGRRAISRCIRSTTPSCPTIQPI